MTRLPFLHHSPQTFSRLIFGTWRLLNADTIKTPQDILALLKVCLDCGITTIDTAEIYGHYHVEEALGAALRLDPGVKARLEIISKFGIYVPSEFHPDRKTSFYNAEAARAQKSVEKSLRLLGVDALDLVLVHRPDWLGNPHDTAAGLSSLVQQGKVKAVGVSNYSHTQFQALQSALGELPLVSNQVEFSPFQLDPIFNGVFDQCFTQGIRPMAWSPTGGGRLFRERESDEASQRVRHCFESLRSSYEDATDDVLCHAWILRHPVEAFSILGTSNPDRIRSATQAAAINLSREHWYAITEAARGARIP